MFHGGPSHLGAFPQPQSFANNLFRRLFGLGEATAAFRLGVHMVRQQPDYQQEGEHAFHEEGSSRSVASNIASPNG